MRNPDASCVCACACFVVVCLFVFVLLLGCFVCCVWLVGSLRVAGTEMLQSVSHDCFTCNPGLFHLHV